MVDQYLYLETETIQNKYWPVVRFCALDFNPIKDAWDILQQKISACNSPKIY